MSKMKAMVLKGVHNMKTSKSPLSLEWIEIPKPNENELLLQNLTCGVCHTELDEIEGRIKFEKYPRVLGHQVIGEVVQSATKNSKFQVGDRVGVAWIGSSCGTCKLCCKGFENVCSEFKATGKDLDGGYAEYMKISQDFAYKIPDFFSDSQAALLLCGGAIGWRSLKLTGMKNGDSLGLTGFGSSAHLVLKMVKYLYPETDVYVFARDSKQRDFAKELGAVWAGNTADEILINSKRILLDTIIDTTPVWKPVVEALKNLMPAGRLVINAIRKEDFDKDYLLKMQYPTHMWLEKEIKSVANVARSDVIEFLEIAEKMKIRPKVEEYSLEDANKALVDLKFKKGNIGGKVIRINNRKEEKKK